uniref:Neuropeptide CCHamide-2 receptor-like n=2 Tax=Dermatophagoides pteronyssinus TaxID=6956 RepID=A0A6P6YKJ1_DERPT|nr:neuropeptide CCHamide-2 receptor-like [Dermatophagoides pteronyssinus]
MSYRLSSLLLSTLSTSTSSKLSNRLWPKSSISKANSFFKNAISTMATAVIIIVSTSTSSSSSSISFTSSISASSLSSDASDNSNNDSLSSSSSLMMALMNSFNNGENNWPSTSTSRSIRHLQPYLPSSVHYGSLLSEKTTAQQQKQQQQHHPTISQHYYPYQQQQGPQPPPSSSSSPKLSQPNQPPQYSQYPFAYNPNQIMWPPEDNWNSWNRVFKLILLSFVSTIGSMGAIFIVSAITVIDTFQVRGNCFLVSLAFGHLLVTVLILPASAIAIMADITEDQTLCHFQWLITLACFIVSILSFLFMSIDNYFGMKSLITYHLCCTKCRICFLIIFIWLAAFIIPFLQHSNHFGPEFCKDKRHWKIMPDYHPYALGFLIICTIITLAYFTYSLFMYKNYKIQLESTPEAANFILTDGCLLQSNVIVYVCSLAMWLPLIVTMVVDTINPVPQDYLNTVWYIAISNSCSFSYMYAATNRDFRDAFNKLFYYCCCKSHVTFSRKGATIRRTVVNESMGLRVHIIPGLNIYAQRKDTMSGNTATTSYRSGGYGSSGGGGGGNFGGGSSGGGFFGSHHGGGGGGGGGSHSAGHYPGTGYYRSHKSCEL